FAAIFVCLVWALVTFFRHQPGLLTRRSIRDRLSVTPAGQDATIAPRLMREFLAATTNPGVFASRQGAAAGRLRDRVILKTAGFLDRAALTNPSCGSSGEPLRHESLERATGLGLLLPLLPAATPPGAHRFRFPSWLRAVF